MAREAGGRRLARAWRLLLHERRPPFPLLRLTGAFLAGVLVGVGLLYGLTGQDFPSGRPMQVVFGADMMHCQGGPSLSGGDCAPGSFGRIGTLDPGDLLFVKQVDGGEEVATTAEGSSRRYGERGDVVVVSLGHGRQPLLHRALLRVNVDANGTYEVPGLGVQGSSTLDHAGIIQLAGCDLTEAAQTWPRDSSVFVTKGDANPVADQCVPAVPPVTMPQVTGVARGEVPWLGLLVLFLNDLHSGTDDFGHAPSDCKAAFALAVSLVAGLALGLAVRQRHHGRGPQAALAKNRQRKSRP